MAIFLEKLRSGSRPTIPRQPKWLGAGASQMRECIGKLNRLKGEVKKEMGVWLEQLGSEDGLQAEIVTQMDLVKRSVGSTMSVLEVKLQSAIHKAKDKLGVPVDGVEEVGSGTADASLSRINGSRDAEEVEEADFDADFDDAARMIALQKAQRAKSFIQPRMNYRDAQQEPANLMGWPKVSPSDTRPGPAHWSTFNKAAFLPIAKPGSVFPSGVGFRTEGVLKSSSFSAGSANHTEGVLPGQSPVHCIPMSSSTCLTAQQQREQEAKALSEWLAQR